MDQIINYKTNKKKLDLRKFHRRLSTNENTVLLVKHLLQIALPQQFPLLELPNAPCDHLHFAD